MYDSQCLIGRMVSGVVLLVLFAGGVATTRADEGKVKSAKESEGKEKQVAESDRAVEGAKIKARLQQLENEIRELRKAGKTDAAEKLLLEFRSLSERSRSLASEKKEKPEAQGPPAEVRERAQQLARQIEELKKSGRADEAAKLQKELQAIAEKFGKKSPRGREDELQQKRAAIEQQVRKLLEAGETDKAEQLKREAAKLFAQPDKSSGEVKQRLMHLRAAVEHLNAAGAHDVAERIASRIKEIEKELAAKVEPENKEK